VTFGERIVVIFGALVWFAVLTVIFKISTDLISTWWKGRKK
jgi:hypothetical protein